MYLHIITALVVMCIALAGRSGVMHGQRWLVWEVAAARLAFDTSVFLRGPTSRVFPSDFGSFTSFYLVVRMHVVATYVV